MGVPIQDFMRISDLDGLQSLVPSQFARDFLIGLGAPVKGDDRWAVWRRQAGMVNAKGATKAQSLSQRHFFLMLVRLQYNALCSTFEIPPRPSESKKGLPTIDRYHLEDIANLWFDRHPNLTPEDAILDLLKDNGGTIPASRIPEVIEAWTGKKPSPATVRRWQAAVGYPPSLSKRKPVTLRQIYRILPSSKKSPRNFLLNA